MLGKSILCWWTIFQIPAFLAKQLSSRFIDVLASTGLVIYDDCKSFKSFKMRRINVDVFEWVLSYKQEGICNLWKSFPILPNTLFTFTIEGGSSVTSRKGVEYWQRLCFFCTNFIVDSVDTVDTVEGEVLTHAQCYPQIEVRADLTNFVKFS